MRRAWRQGVIAHGEAAFPAAQRHAHQLVSAVGAAADQGRAHMSAATRARRWRGLAGRVTLNGRVDRRAFLGALALTAAGAVPSARAAGASGRCGEAAAAAGGGRERRFQRARGTSMTCGGTGRRYAHPIPYTLVRHVPIDLDTVAPADRSS